MKRRSFVKASLITGSLAGAFPLISQASSSTNSNTEYKANQELYEIRVYNLKDQSQQTIVENYYQNAAIPALNDAGSKKIGFFTELRPEGQTRLFVLIPFRSLDDFISMPGKLQKNSAYLKAAAQYLNADAKSPAYERIESSLFRAFAGMPQLEVPEQKPRIFELRRYESHSETAGKKKIEMFNDLGEIDIFKRVGLTPVFFGEALIGQMRPNLTYMLTFDDMDEHGRNWKTFISDPEWKRISAIPEFADAKIVSKITSTFLAPAAFSQI